MAVQSTEDSLTKASSLFEEDAKKCKIYYDGYYSPFLEYRRAPFQGVDDEDQQYPDPEALNKELMKETIEQTIYNSYDKEISQALERDKTYIPTDRAAEKLKATVLQLAKQRMPGAVVIADVKSPNNLKPVHGYKNKAPIYAYSNAAAKLTLDWKFDGYTDTRNSLVAEQQLQNQGTESGALPPSIAILCPTPIVALKDSEDVDMADFVKQEDPKESAPTDQLSSSQLKSLARQSKDKGKQGGLRMKVLNLSAYNHDVDFEYFFKWTSGSDLSIRSTARKAQLVDHLARTFNKVWSATVEEKCKVVVLNEAVGGAFSALLFTNGKPGSGLNRRFFKEIWIPAFRKSLRIWALELLSNSHLEQIALLLIEPKIGSENILDVKPEEKYKMVSKVVLDTIAQILPTNTYRHIRVRLYISSFPVPLVLRAETGDTSSHSYVGSDLWRHGSQDPSRVLLTNAGNPSYVVGGTGGNCAGRDRKFGSSALDAAMGCSTALSALTSPLLNPYLMSNSALHAVELPDWTSLKQESESKKLTFLPLQDTKFPEQKLLLTTGGGMLLRPGARQWIKDTGYGVDEALLDLVRKLVEKNRVVGPSEKKGTYYQINFPHPWPLY